MLLIETKETGGGEDNVAGHDGEVQAIVDCADLILSLFAKEEQLSCIKRHRNVSYSLENIKRLVIWAFLMR